jgi:hypothetical protein
MKPITRIDTFPTEGIPPSPDQCTVHRYPFDTLPIIKSHLHPKFAIVNSGDKMHRLQKLDGKVFAKALGDFPSLRLLKDVYTAWTGWVDVNDPSFNVSRVVPLDFHENDDVNGGDGDDADDSDYDDRTIPLRAGSKKNASQASPTRKRKRANPAPQASGSNRKVLSETSLSKHNEQRGTHLWSDRRILKWRASSHQVADKKSWWLG